MALYGFDIAGAHVELGGEPPEYEQVEPTYYESRAYSDQKVWVELIYRHEKYLPDEFINAVLKSAKQNGLYP